MIFRAGYQEFVRQIQGSLRYWLFLPAEYDRTMTASYPLILFLHGSGERGSKLSLIHNNGLTRRLMRWPECPFIVVAPQCPLDSVWVFELDMLDGLLSEIVKAYRVDETRIYLTGMSLGGTGTWHMAMKYPERFAASAPICGNTPGRSLIGHLKDVPTWIFHGAKDPIIPVSASETMAKALQEAGGEVRLTIYPEGNHDAWTITYENPELFTWFLQHRKT